MKNYSASILKTICGFSSYLVQRKLCENFKEWYRLGLLKKIKYEIFKHHKWDQSSGSFTVDRWCFYCKFWFSAYRRKETEQYRIVLSHSHVDDYLCLCLASSPTLNVYPSEWKILLKSSHLIVTKRKIKNLLSYKKNKKSANQKDTG